MSAVAALFAKYVKNGTYTIDMVPELWLEQVKEHLKEVADEENKHTKDN